MNKLYALVPVVAAILLIQVAGFDKKGSFDLAFTGSSNLPEYTKTPPGDASVRLTDLDFVGDNSPEYTKLPPESVQLGEVEFFGRQLTLEYTKTPPGDGVVTFPLA